MMPHAFKQSLSHTSRCTMLFDLLLPWCIIMYSLNLSMIFIIFSISLILFQFIWFSQICHFDYHVDRTRPWFNRISTSWMFILLKLFVITFNVIILARRNFHFGSQFKKLVKEKFWPYNANFLNAKKIVLPLSWCIEYLLFDKNCFTA